MPDNLVFTVFLIYAGAALLATLALYARQSLLVAYMLLGVLLGPWGLKLVGDAALIGEIAEFGIVFLLFLLGLDLQPQELLRLVKKTTLVTLVSSIIFAGVGWTVSLSFGFTLQEAVLIGGATTFSSTIIGLKLLPTTVLHHQRSGEIIISILLLQDLIAIVMLLLLQGWGTGRMSIWLMFQPLLALPLLFALALALERYALRPLIRKFDKIREYIFLMAIGWCLGVAELANLLGLSIEIGAFIAGVTLASNPISLYIAESLRPLRDFFLVMFFFSLGAGFDLGMIPGVLLPAAVLAGLAVLIKPPVFRWLLRRTGESDHRSHEIGYRLGQMSEFSLLIAVLALELGVIQQRASYLIQLATLITFLFSSYIVVRRFPTPIAVSDALRRD